MIRHLLKMVWNRKRVNGLLMIEIFVSFLVLFIVLTATAYYVSNYHRPLGYSIDRVWDITAHSRLPRKGFDKVRADGLRRLELAMRDLPEIESVGWIEIEPYSRSTSIHGSTFNGAEVDVEINSASDESRKVLNMPLTAGRWFSREDDASQIKPVVINEQFAHVLFGSEDPIGKQPLDSNCRVVGVLQDFRKDGEFSAPVNYQFSRFRMEDTTDNHYGSFVIRVREGTTASFQGRLIGVLESVQRGWSFDIETLATARETNFKLHLAPLIAGGVISLFLLSMVALGLVGVLWQNVSQRTKEIGLRRALGGTARNVSRQIHGEQIVITTLGVAAGSILMLQLPLLDLIDFIPPGIYLTALVLSLAVMYGITYLCSLFPGWLAMAVQPADALHYE
jgi:putative ABC transport system permease protein